MFGKKLHSKSDRDLYRTRYEMASGGKISDEYINNATVRGFYNKSGEMVAGYIVNTRPDFRYLRYIPESEIPKVCLNPHTDRIAEVTCIWIDRKKLRFLQRYQIYTQLIADSLTSGADFILGGSVVEKVRNVQFPILNNHLWEGISTESQYQWIYFGKRDEIVTNYIKELMRIAKKHCFYVMKNRVGSSLLKLKAGQNKAR